MDFFDVVEKRKSIRSFEEKPVEEEKLKKILNAIYLSPSAGNLQARKILIIKDQETKQKLNEFSGGQNSLTEAPIVLAFFYLPKESAARYDERGEKMYALQDATIAISYAQLAATAEGLASVWIGAFDDEKVKETLQASEGFEPAGLLPIGYAAEEGHERDRKEWNETFFEEKF